MSQETTLSVRLTNTCPHGKPSNTCCGYAEWLQVIHAVNAADNAAGREPSFGEPTSMHDWWAGGWCEEYPEFRVILRDDGTTNVQARTPEAKSHLHAAVLAVTGLDVDDNGMAR